MKPIRAFLPRLISPLLGGGAVGHAPAPFSTCSPYADDRALVDAGALVGAHELDELVVVRRRRWSCVTMILSAADTTPPRRRASASTHTPESTRGLVLHAGAHDGRLGVQQRHRLTLHVGAHQGAVGVVVLQEGDHSRSHGNHHLGENVHVVHALLRRPPGSRRGSGR